jgi:uncharacterized protein (TIGR02246 family)
MSTSSGEQPEKQKDEQQIRHLIHTWGKATASGDLAAQLNLMTADVTFLTPGRAPMRRDEFAAQFRRMVDLATVEVGSEIQEITISGDLAVCWNLLHVSFTSIAGGETRKLVGNVLTALRKGPDGQWRIWRDANMLAPV